MSAAKTSFAPGPADEWEAMITWRHGPYKIRTSRRSQVCGNSHMSDEIEVNWGPTRYALTLHRALRKAERMVDQLNRRDGLNAPIAPAVDASPSAAH
jgi:hypothetical protein